MSSQVTVCYLRSSLEVVAHVSPCRLARRGRSHEVVRSRGRPRGRQPRRAAARADRARRAERRRQVDAPPPARGARGAGRGPHPAHAAGARGRLPRAGAGRRGAARAGRRRGRRSPRVLRGGFDVLLLDEPTNDLDFAGLALARACARGASRLARRRLARPRLPRPRRHAHRRARRVDARRRRSTAAAGASTRPSASGGASATTSRWEASVAERRRIEEQQRRMAEWERRGYGQGRKKKKSKDVKRTYGAKLAQVETVEKPYEPWELQLSLAPAARSGDVVVRLEDAVVERGSFRLGPLDLEVGWGDRLAIAGPNGSGKTTLLDALLGRLPLAAGSALARPGRRARRARAGSRRAHRAAAAARRLPRLRATARRRARCSRSSASAPTTSSARPRRSRRASARAPASRSSPPAASTASSSTSRRTTSTSRRSRSSSAALAGYDGTVILVTHDRRFLEAFAPGRTIEL